MPDRQLPGGPGPGTGPRRGLFTRNPFLIILLILAVVFIVNSLFNPGSQVEINYSEFRQVLYHMPVLFPSVYSRTGSESGATGAGQATDPPASDKGTIIESLSIRPTELRGILKADLKDPILRKKEWGRHIDPSTNRLPFFCVRQVEEDKSLLDDLAARGINYKYETPTDWNTLWLWGLPIVFFVFIMMMMFRSSRMTGENVLAFGRSRAKIVGEEKTGVTFADVAGADESKEELTEIVDFLKEPERFTALGGRIPKGVLLMGPPGCGKTLLARAVAGEAGVPFFSISGSDFVEMFVGVGAARVRDLFNTAKQKAPCIIFVDEIDAVGRHRGTGLGGGHDEREQTLNQLLVEMDGFDGRKGVIVIAATNRPDILDPALLRPGRFDRHVVLDSPDLRGREAILRIHSRGKPLQAQVDLSLVARRTPGFSGADLANVMNEAALLAARRNRKDITGKEIEEAVERVVAGPERRSRIIGPREKRILAYHELGHALVARFSPHADPVHKVSIIPRGKGALGYTLMLPEEDRYILTREELIARIRVTLGGRTAEEVVFGHQSTGAEDDLQKVTQLTRSLVCRWGMTEELGPITYQHAPGNPFLGRDLGAGDGVSDETSARIDGLVRDIVEKCHQEAREIIQKNRTLMDRLAEHLIETEMLNLEEFEAAVQRFAETPPPPLRPDVLADLRTPATAGSDAPLAGTDTPPPMPPAAAPPPLGS